MLILKAQLRPPALTTRDPAAQHSFCPDPTCDSVYFAGGRTFGTTDLKVPVQAKDAGVVGEPAPRDHRRRVGPGGRPCTDGPPSC